MARTFPAVMVYGLLESGKTQFIIDSLKNKDFGDLGKVLVISTEEGEVEYNAVEMNKYNASFEYITSPEDFTVENINELIKIHKPHAVFFEINAMWDWSKIEFPPYIIAEQSFSIIDSSTFKVYFNNMRQKFVDFVKVSDIIIMNRCEENSETAGYKRNLKLINNSAYYICLDKVGKPVSFVEELPYKLSNDMKIGDDDFGIFYIDTFDNLQRYEDKIVEFNCMTVLSKNLPPKSFVAGRLAMTCCVNDIQLIGHLCAYQGDFTVKDREWIHLRCRIHALKESEDDEPQVILEYLSSYPISEIQNPVVSLT